MTIHMWCGKLWAWEGKFPEHTNTNTTMKRHVKSKSFCPKVNQENCGNDWRHVTKHFRGKEILNYWRCILKEGGIISKSFWLFTLYCTESINDVSCIVSYLGYVERATTKITPPAVCLPSDLWLYRSYSSFTSDISHRSDLLKSNLLGK